MKNALEKLKLVFLRLAAWVPTPLPVGKPAMDKWLGDVIKIYGAPDNESVRGALAVQVIHSGETQFYRPKRYFGNKLRKGMANEVAHACFIESKERLDARNKKEAEDAKKTKESSENGQQSVQTPTS